MDTSIIHSKHNSTDKSLYFISHQNPPFLSLDPPFIYKTALYTNEIQYPTLLPIFWIFKTHPF